MALTFVQAPSTEGAATGTSVPLAYGSNTTGSSLLFALGLVATASAVTLSVTDSLGNTWTQIGGNLSNGSNTLALFWAKNSAGGGANTVTLNSTVSAALRLDIAEYTGQATSNPIDIVGSANWPSTSASIGPILTSFTNEQFIAFARLASGGTAVTGADGTVRLSSAASNAVLEDRSIPAGGSYTASWTNSGSASGGSGFVVGVKSTTSVPVSTSTNWVSGHRAFVNKRGYVRSR